MSPRNRERNLDNAQVVLSRIYERVTAHHNILSWRIRDYQELKPNILYYHMCESEDIKCVLRLFIEDEVVNVFVCGVGIPLDEMSQFMIIDENSGNSEPIKTEIIDKIVFTAKLKIKDLPLKNGVLTVGFKYVSDSYATYKEVDYNEKEVLSDLDELCCDLRNMYLDAVYPDFKIHLKEHTFSCHKFMLAARSKFFDKSLKDEDEEHVLSHDCPAGILHEVLVFIYSGELRTMDMEGMMEVYKLAVHLKIDSLFERCMDYFKEAVDVDNYEDICKVIVEYNFKNARKEISSAIRNKLSIDPTGVIKELLKQHLMKKQSKSGK